MMIVQKLFKIELDGADQVVAAATLTDYVLIISARGVVYKVFDTEPRG